MKNLSKDRQLVRNAAVNLINERHRFKKQTAFFRDGFERYRPAILLSGGFVMGLVLGRKQFIQATRSIASIASLSVSLMNSSLGSMLVAATLGKAPRSKSNPATATQQAQS